MRAQCSTLQSASLGRLERFPVRCGLRRGRGIVFPCRRLARRLQLLSAPTHSARTHLIFWSRFSQRSFRPYSLRDPDTRVGWASRFNWSAHRRDHNAVVLFRQRVAQSVALSFPDSRNESSRRGFAHRFVSGPVMKIGFIAMSGLRLCNAELLQLGLTFPGVARRKQAIEALPSLGLLTLAGMTPDKIGMQYLEVRDVNNDELPRDFDAVAISSLTATAKEAYALAARFRQIGTKVLLGGLHVSLVPDEAVANADSIVIGEGESVWSQVIVDLERNQLKPVYDARVRPFNLANAPMPRFELLEPARYPRFTVQTQRGCPWRCEFCAASIRISSTFKVKPVQKVIAEIRHLKELWRDPFIEFADDNTFVNRAHGKELMCALAPERIRWFTESDLSIAQDEELLRLMRDAGCAQVLIGFESPSRAPLNGIEQKTNWKARQFGSYCRAVEIIQSHGITVNGCFVMGLDGAGPESFDAVYEFVKESGLFDVQITFMTPFPATPLYKRLRNEGRILEERAWERCTLFDINFSPQQMSVSELQNGFSQLGLRLYADDFVRERCKRFVHQLRSARRDRRPLAA